MPEATLVSLATIVFAGLLLGGFTLPMKFATRWPWEAIWLVYSLTGLILFPVITAVETLPSLSGIYAHSTRGSLASAGLFGFGWGIASVLFGIGVSRLGMALGFSVILGITAALGSLIPMLVLTPSKVATSKGAAVLAGLAIVLMGICLCGVASGIKERADGEASAQVSGSLRTGLIICTLSGIGASMLNLAMAFGQDIALRAIQLGATPSNASNAIWVLAVAFGAIANIGYCILLLVRNRSAVAFRIPKTVSHWLLGALMGTLWFGGVNIYGRGAAALGTWGAVVGWPLLMAVMIVTANVLGWLTGEWRNTSGRARSLMLAGVAVLSAGVVLVGYSGTL